jgi:hypothetical protein
MGHEIQLGEALQDDFEWQRECCGPSVQHCRTLNLTIEFPANSIWRFDFLL